MKRSTRLVWVLALVLALVACETDEAGDDSAPPMDDDADDDADDDDAAGDWTWRLDDDGSLQIAHGGRVMQTLLGVQRKGFTPLVSMLFGFFSHLKRHETTGLLTMDRRDGRIVLLDVGRRAGDLEFVPTPTGNLDVRVRLNGAFAGQAIRLIFVKSAQDRFWAFGEQYNFVDLGGRRFPIWTQEQGFLGRTEAGLFPGVAKLTDSYFPMPYFLDPIAGKGFLLNNVEFSEFDLGRGSPGQWWVETWNGHEARFSLFPGPAPADVVAQLSDQVGRPDRLPPAWTFEGVWLAAQGGSDTVRQRVQTALDAGVPVTAVWVQDWLGQRHFGFGNYGVKYRWIPDRELYPDLEGLIAELRDKGVRFLGYFNPFIVPAYEHYPDAVANDYLIRRPNGQPYLFLITSFFGSLLDVTRPEAVAYFQSFAIQAAEMGMAGWMADFGEWLPFDAVIAQGEAPAVHNLYPAIWHRINREVLEWAYPDGDYALLTRSGFTGDSKEAQFVWAGDQEATWSVDDGLPTVVTAGLTIGLSGVPFYTHDVGGFSGGPRTKELFLRWTELGAFTPVMRTHEGVKGAQNHQFDSNAETLAHFALFSKIHRALLPMWLALANEALEAGLPMVRHTVLVDPTWSPAAEAHGQWMLGSDLLFAPVTAKGADAVTVAFPSGAWEHLLTGEPFPGRSVQTVPAPIGTPAVFVRAGTWIDVAAKVRALFSESAR